jgi:tetratricopeptide (TPR) repeat protein
LVKLGKSVQSAARIAGSDGMNHLSSTGLPDFDTLWDYNQPAQSEERFRELLPAARASGDRDYHLQLLTQIARAQGLARQFEAAHATLDHVREAMTCELPTVRIRYLLERGRCFNDSGNHERARECFLQAWELGQAERLDGYAVDAAHMMGIIEPPTQAMAWNLRAVEYAKASNHSDARRWLASLQNNIGWTYHAMGQYAEALAVFEEALRLYQAQGKARQVRIARWSIAKMQRLLGRMAEALPVQESLLGECERAREPDGYVHEELAECLQALGRGRTAAPHFARAYQLLHDDPGFPADESARLQRLKELGKSK